MFWVSVNQNQGGKSDKYARKGQERSGSLPPGLSGAIGKSLDFFFFPPSLPLHAENRNKEYFLYLGFRSENSAF